MNEIGDCADFEAVPSGKFCEFRQPCHGTIITHDLANHTNGTAAGELDQVHGRFGVAGTLQDSSGTSAQGKHMAWLDQLLRNGRRLGHNSDRFRPVRGAYSGSDAQSGIDADLEIGFGRHGADGV